MVWIDGQVAARNKGGSDGETVSENEPALVDLANGLGTGLPLCRVPVLTKWRCGKFVAGWLELPFVRGFGSRSLGTTVRSRPALPLSPLPLR